MSDLDLRLKFPPTPENAAALAELAAQAARKISGVAADYSPESLHEIDELVDRLAKDCAVEDVAETLFCLGCYVGEVIVRRLHGRWVKREASRMKEFARWPLVVEVPDGGAWNPIGKVFKRFEFGPGESVFHLFESASPRPR